jgi:hypothetical protein
MSDLGAYLQRALRTPWVYGQWDCVGFIAGWCIERGRPDPMTMRGRYSTARGALRIMKRSGGLAALVGNAMARVAIPQVQGEPEPGDIGVIITPTDDRTNRACAIWTGARWASLGVRGLICQPAEHVALWRP